MANIVLAALIIAIAAAWRRSGFWMPRGTPIANRTRGWFLRAAGLVVLLLAGGFSMGDVIAGRTQISKAPVRYATRLSGPQAHHHDVVDGSLFWRQVLLQSGVAILVGGALVALSGVRLPINRRRVA